MRRFSVLIVTMLCVFFLNISLAGASEEKEKSGSSEYIKLDPLFLPIIDEDGVQQVVSMVIAIEVVGLSDADKIKAMRPKLTDAYIQDMYGVLNKHAALKGGVIQIHMIKKRLNEITDRVVGDEIDTEVLIQVIQQHPI